MAEHIQHHFVNWQPGMQVSVNNFLDLENAVIDRYRDSIGARTTAFNYGLLHCISENDTSLNYALRQPTDDTVYVEVQTCRAITRAGNRIEIYPGIKKDGISTEEQLGVQGDSTTHYIIIGLKAFERTFVGEQKPNEAFDRPPYTIPTYDLRIIPEKELNSPEFHTNYIPIGKLKFENNRWIEDSNYVPPCATISSHPTLKKHHTNLRHLISRLFEYCLRIIQIVNIQNNKYDKKKQGSDYELAAYFKGLCERLSQFFAKHIPEFDHVLEETAPVFTVNLFASLAYITQGHANTCAEEEEQQMYEYVKSLTNMDRGEMENATKALILTRYNHKDVEASFQLIETYMKQLYTLLNKLRELDYIGLKKEEFQFFVKEQDTEREIKKKYKKDGFSFLTD